MDIITIYGRITLDSTPQQDTLSTLLPNMDIITIYGRITLDSTPQQDTLSTMDIQLPANLSHHGQSTGLGLPRARRRSPHAEELRRGGEVCIYYAFTM